MKTFGGRAYFIDRDNINTDEIIPAKYLTLIDKEPLKPHLLEDLKLGNIDPKSIRWDEYGTVISRANFGSGSSREAAVWAFEINGVHLILASNFARIFRENAFNSGLLAITLGEAKIDEIFQKYGNSVDVNVKVDIDSMTLELADSEKSDSYQFQLNSLEKDLVTSGGWVALASEKY